MQDKTMLTPYFLHLKRLVERAISYIFKYYFIIIFFLIPYKSYEKSLNHFILVENNYHRHICNFLEIKENTFYCIEKMTYNTRTFSLFKFDQITSIIIIDDGNKKLNLGKKKFKDPQFIKLINEFYKKQKIKLKIKAIEEQKKEYFLKKLKRRSIPIKCQKDCLVNKYQFNESCFKACMITNGISIYDTEQELFNIKLNSMMKMFGK